MQRSRLMFYNGKLVSAKEITEDKFRQIVEDAERIMGFRERYIKHKSFMTWDGDRDSYHKYLNAPMLLEPPPEGDPVRVYAEHILSLTWPVMEVHGLYPEQFLNTCDLVPYDS